MNQLTLPSIESKELELADIKANYIQVNDVVSHDQAIEGIRTAKDFIDGVNAFFDKFERPLKEAVDAMTTQKKSLIDPAVAYQNEHRLRCKTWQIAATKAAEDARLIAIERARTAAPWEDVPEVPETVGISSSGAGLRNKPWQARVDDIEVLWEAAVKDPRYREYFIVDMKALTAKARSQGEMFNIPGCSSLREKTLSIRG